MPYWRKTASTPPCGRTINAAPSGRSERRQRYDKEITAHLRPQREGGKGSGEGRILVLCVQSGSHVPRRGSPVYSSTPAWLSGGRRQSHGRVLALCGLCPWRWLPPAVRPPLVPVRLSLHRHLPGECQPPGEPWRRPLRRLPLSFFGNRDLSDLTSTMIADCSSLDQMFSHYVPQLFASVGSTLVIGVCMFACDWRMPWRCCGWCLWRWR